MDDMNPGREATRLVLTRRWFALATVDGAGAPLLSYVPFVFVDGMFGMVASRLAAHTANLLAGRAAVIMFVDGAEQSDAYAQPRLSMNVQPLPRARGSTDAGAIWSALEA